METPHRGEPILISQSISGILRTSAKLSKELGQYVAKLNNDSAARQLRTQPLRLAVLGWLTWSAGLSFRGMWSIAEKMVDRDANVGEPEFRDYVEEIIAHGRQEIPSALEVVKSSYRWTWTLHSIVWLLDRVRQNAPRARS